MKLVISVLILLILIALGLAMASNFRGIATRQAKASLETARPFRIQFQRNQTGEALQRRLAMVAIINRVLGLVFALMCLAGLISVIATG